MAMYSLLMISVCVCVSVSVVLFFFLYYLFCLFKIFMDSHAKIIYFACLKKKKKTQLLI